MRGRGWIRGRVASALVVALASLSAAACGARLSTEQREVGIASGGTGTGPGSTVDGLAGGRPGDSIGPGNADSAGGPGGAAGPGGGGPGLGEVPAGGNGGATDVGVTADSIRIATIANISGVQPGLFKSVHQAMQAVAAYANQQGGIYGRRIELMLLDDQTNSGGNRAATVEACDEAFALVGSMSAFDDGGAETGEKCGIPDLTAIPTNASRALADNIFAAFPNRPDYYTIGPAEYIKERYPGVVKKAAFLWLNASVTRTTAMRRIEVYESLGYKFVVKREVQILEPNYSPYVLQMREEGVKYVSMVADFQSISRLLEAMRQQNWYPTVRDWDSVTYDPDFLEDAGPAAEGSHIYLNTTIFEELGSNPEMQLYLQWLEQVAPGAEPDYFGLYAWSAGRLFLEAASAAGPELTREKLIQVLRAMPKWSGHGLHAAHNVGDQIPSPCFMYVQVRDGRFVREEPSSGLSCKYRVIRI